MRRTGRFMSDIGYAVLAVLGFVSLVVWLVEVFEEGRHPFNFWAVLTLAILLAAALFWGLRRGAVNPPPAEQLIVHSGGTVHKHDYHLHIGEARPGAVQAAMEELHAAERGKPAECSHTSP